MSLAHKRLARTGRPLFAGPLTLYLLLSLVGATGLYFGLPNARLHLPLLCLLYPFCLYLLSRLAPSDRQALGAGWLAGFAANAAGLYWLIYPMRDVAGIPLLLALPAALLLYAFLACYSALAVLGMRRLQGLFARKTAPQAPTAAPTAARALLPPLLGALAFGGFQVLCGVLFTGFPWLSLASAFAFSPAWVQAASVTGGYALGALYAAPACLAAAALLAGSRAERATCLALAALMLAALPGFGLFRLAEPLSAPGEALSLLMVQGNVDQNQKWEPAFQQATLELYMDISRDALAKERQTTPENPPALLIWPETAMPVYFPLHREYAEKLRAFAGEQQISLLFGSLGLEYAPDGGERLHNRINLLSTDGESRGWYDKLHLVPFGEYMPFAAKIPYLSRLLQGIDFAPGNRARPLPFAPAGGPGAGELTGLSLGPLICYEAIFPSLAQEQVEQGAEILVNVSNDGWFRDSSAPYQHLAHAVLRAVEQARPLVRATNTGISAVLDAHGRISARLDGLFVSGSLAAKVSPASLATLYHRLYPIPEILLVLAALLSLCGHGIIHRKRHASTA